MKAYPDIDGLILWFRIQRTVVMGVQLDELPPAWRKEYEAAVHEKPDLAKYWRSVGLFVISKIVRAYQRALGELGNKEVEVAIGTWGFDLLPAADHFMPAGVRFFPLDLGVLGGKSWFDVPEKQARIARYAADRNVVPIAWAQHDDGEYVGPPYVPYKIFYDRLKQMSCARSGFGIIHWTTRPLDIYFKNLARQTWQSTRNESIEKTCRQMSIDMFGPAVVDEMTEYLLDWLQNQRRIGRDTTDFFIDHELSGVELVREGFKRRMQMLDAINQHKLSTQSRKSLGYFKWMEKFILALHENDLCYNRTRSLLQAGDYSGARKTFLKADPEGALRCYATAAALPGVTRGEQGLVVSLNTRWLAHYTRLAQELGMKSIRYNFASTSHDPLAQVRGVFTYHLDPQRRSWFVLGHEETGQQAYGDLAGRIGTPFPKGAPSQWGICQSGIESDTAFSFEMRPIMLRDNRDKFYKKPPVIAPGDYRLVLWFGGPGDLKTGARQFDVIVKVSDASEAMIRRIDLSKTTAKAFNMGQETFAIKLRQPGYVSVTLKPIKGKARICGAELHPAR